MARSHTLLRLGCSAALAAAVGCRSDLNQQLLERELRLQEDQIYQLQDELHSKAARLDRAAMENSSLKKQLGIVDPNASLPTRSLPPPGVAAPASPSATLQPPALNPPAALTPQPPALMPPSIEVPPIDAPGIEFVPPPKTVPAPKTPPASAAPPAPFSIPSGSGLEGVPPIPEEPAKETPAPTFRGTSFQPPADPPPPVKRLSHEESLAVEQGITHIVINPARTVMFDGDGDGKLDGLTVVFEPRDRDERLVSAVGDVVVTAFDASAPLDAPPVASWEIPSQEALQHFRRTSRARGLHFVLRWPALPPSTDQLRVVVRMSTFEGKSFEQEATTGR